MNPGPALATKLPILLIEDEPSVIAFLRAALERRGYAVVDACSGEEGLKQLSNGRYAGVISDIRMPGAVNGAEVHEWIQKNRPELKSRIILISEIGRASCRERVSFLV